MLLVLYVKVRHLFRRVHHSTYIDAQIGRGLIP